jgi:hypothetical protein
MIQRINVALSGGSLCLEFSLPAPGRLSRTSVVSGCRQFSAMPKRQAAERHRSAWSRAPKESPMFEAAASCAMSRRALPYARNAVATGPKAATCGGRVGLAPNPRSSAPQESRSAPEQRLLDVSDDAGDDCKPAHVLVIDVEPTLKGGAHSWESSIDAAHKAPRAGASPLAHRRTCLGGGRGGKCPDSLAIPLPWPGPVSLAGGLGRAFPAA